MKKIKGFTLIELIMVIVILGILAAVAIPRFFALSDDAKDSAEQGVVGGVRAGIATLHANNRVKGTTPYYPATLDSVAASTACSDTNPCFDTVLAQGGITDGDWAKGSTTTEYIHTGTNTSTYVYTPTGADAGKFICTTNCP